MFVDMAIRKRWCHVCGKYVIEPGEKHLKVTTGNKGSDSFSENACIKCVKELLKEMGG